MILAINNLEDVATFTRNLIEEGSTVHPDDDFREFINISTGEPTYTEEEAIKRNSLMDKAIKICEAKQVDIYDFMQDVFLKETGLDKFIPNSNSTVPDTD